MRSFTVINLIGHSDHGLHKWIAILINYALIIEPSECIITLAELLYRLHKSVSLHLEPFSIL
jgi:hypothetical protein